MNKIKFDIDAVTPEKGLLVDDLDYIETKFIHSRYAESSKSKLSADVAKVYESARTLMTIARLLQTMYTITRIEVVGHIDLQSMVCNLYIASDANIMITLQYIHSEGYGFDVIVYADYEHINTMHFPLHESGIMSYAMNFPPPSTLIKRIQSAVGF